MQSMDFKSHSFYINIGGQQQFYVISTSKRLVDRYVNIYVIELFCISRAFLCFPRFKSHINLYLVLDVFHVDPLHQ